MSLETYCSNPTCGRRYVFPSGSAGRSVRCNACGQTFIAGGTTTVNVPRTPLPPTPPPAHPPTHTPARAPSAPAPALASETAEPMSLSSDESLISGKVNVTLASTLDTSLGRFVVRDRLGAGAFGTVYRAYDPHLEREVALKVPNPGSMDTPKRVERFLREAKAAARLRHPHIVPVFDAGQDGDRYYIASAFIDGQPLAEAVADEGMEFDRAARITRELAEALGYAHGQGIVHRDVKPQNVMLDRNDGVHLMDFGLAARNDEEAKLTADGAVMGTACYMAPEQAAGQKGEAQATVDQYAVGVVLYELLTGRTPFSGPLAVVIHNVINTEPDPPSKFRPDVPKDLETICLKAMAKRPEDRYIDCQELADDLRRWQEGEPIAARQVGFRERAVRWARREPKLAVAMAVVAVVFVTSIVLVSGAARRAESARKAAEQDAEAARTAEKRAADALAAAQAAGQRADEAAGQTLGAIGTADQERKKALVLQGKLAEEKNRADLLQAELDNERKKATAAEAGAKGEPEVERKRAEEAEARLARVEKHLVQMAYQALQEGNAEEANSILQSVPPERRGWEWRHVRKLGSTPAGASAALVVSGALKGDDLLPAVSPDGSTAVTGDGVWMRLWEVQGGRQTFVLKGHERRASAITFSPDGTRILSVSADGTARLWDAKTGKELFVLKHPTGAVKSATFSPDGAHIVTTASQAASPFDPPAAAANASARLWDAKTGKELFVLKGHEGAPAAAFSPDGARVAIPDGNAVRVWDAKEGKEQFALRGHTGAVISVAFSADGTRIVTTGDDTARVWDATDGKELCSVKGTFPQRPASGTFSPDGTRILAIGPGEVKVADAKNGTEIYSLKGLVKNPGDLVRGAAFSPDGTRIVTLSTQISPNSALVRLWDAKSGVPLLSLDSRSFIGAVAWSADGSKLLLSSPGRVEVRDAGLPKP